MVDSAGTWHGTLLDHGSPSHLTVLGLYAGWPELIAKAMLEQSMAWITTPFY